MGLIKRTEMCVYCLLGLRHVFLLRERFFREWKVQKMGEEMLILENDRILITGVAGFIGANLAKEILANFSGCEVIGVDSITDYYDTNLKMDRLKQLEKYEKFRFLKDDISDKDRVFEIFSIFKPTIVVNLAAQAGVRYSIENPDAYITSNIVGFHNVLEACRTFEGIKHLVYASSSSVYGSNKKMPYSTTDQVDNPVSLYAATKKSNELMAHAYSKIYGIPTTGLRFFTVYGPAGRPDMAYFGFTQKLVKREKIQIYNYGKSKRDFTYITDIVDGVIKVMKKIPQLNQEGVPYKIYNIGNSNPENLLDFVDILQKELISAGVLPMDYDFEKYKEFVPMQPGDVEATYADVSELQKDFGYKPSTPLKAGLRNFARWYKEYYMN